MLNQILKPLCFGHLSIWPPIVVAPMAGYTDGVYREILREFGCPFCYTEMISAKALALDSKATFDLLKHTGNDKPLALQLFGANPEDFYSAIIKINQRNVNFDAIDINMGCPTKKITSPGAGGALLKDLPRAAEIVHAIKSASDLPVTAKMRIGWEDGSNAVGIAACLQEAGIDLLTVHGRTVSQKYAGTAKWEKIADVAASVTIPVVGNGDVASPGDSIDKLCKTKCSGIMIGRGVLGNPFFFYELQELLGTPQLGTWNKTKRMEVAKLHLKRAVEEYGEKRAMLKMRKHLALYFKGMAGSAKLRMAVNSATSLQGVIAAIECFSSRH